MTNAQPFKVEVMKYPRNTVAIHFDDEIKLLSMGEAIVLRDTLIDALATPAPPPGKCAAAP